MRVVSSRRWEEVDKVVVVQNHKCETLVRNSSVMRKVTVTEKARSKACIAVCI